MRKCRPIPALLALATALGIVGPANAQVPVRELIFKGTHNSYQCHGDTPNMGHLVDVQMDDFGVWGIELDIGFVNRNGRNTAVIGHNSAGDGVCLNIQDIYPDLNANALEGYFRLIKRARSFRYRPVVLFLDWKTSDRDGWSDIPCPNNDCNAFAKVATVAVFGVANVLTADEAIGKSVPELAGKVILGMTERFTGDCTNRPSVEEWFLLDQNLNFFRIDQYQGDWTFDIAVPPNPLVVDSSADVQTVATGSIGESWFCVTEFFPPTPNCTALGFPATCDFSNGQVVHEQGTYRFPYRTISGAVRRAQGTTPTGNASLLPRRTGYGWTVLIVPGSYPESLVIDTPLTLKRIDGSFGVVVIGRR
jgi:hypothetical protein